MMCIMNEAKTTTQPQPPSGGVGRSPDDSSVDPVDANDVPSASFALLAAAAAPSFFMALLDSAATMKIAPSSLSSLSSSGPSSSSSCVVGSVRVNSELFLLQVGSGSGDRISLLQTDSKFIIGTVRLARRRTHTEGFPPTGPNFQPASYEALSASLP